MNNPNDEARVAYVEALMAESRIRVVLRRMDMGIIASAPYVVGWDLRMSVTSPGYPYRMDFEMGDEVFQAPIPLSWMRTIKRGETLGLSDTEVQEMSISSKVTSMLEDISQTRVSIDKLYAELVENAWEEE